MANEFVARLGLIAKQDSQLTGSVNVTGSLIVTGSIRSTSGFTGSLLGTSSWALNAVTASFVTTAQTASFVATASWANNATTATQVANSLTQGTGVTAFTYNGSSAQTVAVSGASALTTNRHTKWTGTAFANTNIFDDGTNVQITGSNVIISGASTALIVTGSIRVSAGFTGSITASSLQGSITNAQLSNSSVTIGSTAISLGATSTTLSGLTSVSSTSLTGSITASSLQGAITNAQLSNSSVTVGSTAISLGATATTIAGLTSLTSTSLTGSLLGTASYVTGSIHNSSNPALSASYALTASFALNAGAGNIGGSGTANRITKFTATATIGDSNIFDDGTNVQITGSSVIVSGASTALIVTGSVRSLGGFTGSLLGTSSWALNATSATSATTATQVANSLTQGTGVTAFTYNGSSAQTVAVSGASALTANELTKWSGTAFVDSNIFDNGTSVFITASTVIISGASTALLVTGSVRSLGGFTGSLLGTSSWALNAVTASFASNGGVTSFNTRTGAVTLQASDISNLGAGIVSASSFTSPSQGTLRATINGVQTDVDLGLQTADNVTFAQVTGSNALFSGTITAQTLVVQTVTSSVDFITGSSRFGSLLTDTHRFTGSVSITGSLTVTGPATINNLTGSLFGTSSWAQNAVTASFALNSAGGLKTKASGALAGNFTGNPKTVVVTFTTAFSDNNYSVAIVGGDARSWTIESKTAAGFTINSNSDVALATTTFWTATAFGES